MMRDEECYVCGDPTDRLLDTGLFALGPRPVCEDHFEVFVGRGFVSKEDYPDE